MERQYFCTWNLQNTNITFYFTCFLSCVGGKQELGNSWKLRGKDRLLSGTWNKLQLCSFTNWRETLFNFPTRLYWHWRKCSWSSCSLPNRITLKICKSTSLTTCIAHENKCHSSVWSCSSLASAHTCILLFVEHFVTVLFFTHCCLTNHWVTVTNVKRR